MSQPATQDVKWVWPAVSLVTLMLGGVALVLVRYAQRQRRRMRLAAAVAAGADADPNPSLDNRGGRGSGDPRPPPPLRPRSGRTARVSVVAAHGSASGGDGGGGARVRPVSALAAHVRGGRPTVARAGSPGDVDVTSIRQLRQRRWTSRYGNGGITMEELDLVAPVHAYVPGRKRGAGYGNSFDHGAMDSDDVDEDDDEDDVEDMDATDDSDRDSVNNNRNVNRGERRPDSRGGHYPPRRCPNRAKLGGPNGDATADGLSAAPSGAAAVFRLGDDVDNDHDVVDDGSEPSVYGHSPLGPQASSMDATDDTCAVCLEEMTVGAKTRTLRCGHEFDARCIEEWITKANRCPVCNIEPLEPDAMARRRNARSSARRGIDAAIVQQRRRRTRGPSGQYELRGDGSPHDDGSDPADPVAADVDEGEREGGDGTDSSRAGRGTSDGSGYVAVHGSQSTVDGPVHDEGTGRRENDIAIAIQGAAGSSVHPTGSQSVTEPGLRQTPSRTLLF